MTNPVSSLSFDRPPFQLSGTVYGALLNHRSELAALGDAAFQPPYKSPPREPVLSIRPRNTLATDGDPVFMPPEASDLVVGATLGVVIGRTACRVEAGQALDHVAGYTIVNDLSLPHASHYRPAVRMKARDGFCPMGPLVVTADAVADPDSLAVRIRVDGATVQSTDTGGRIRGAAQLIADVSAFMTLHPGDVLTLGVAAGAPHVHAGQVVSIDIADIGTLTNRVIAAGVRA